MQSLARDQALTLNAGHAQLGVTGTPFMDEVAIEAPTSLLSAGLPKMLGMGARVSKKISEEGIELVLDTARRLDDEAIEAASKARQVLDNSDGIPLHKLINDAPDVATGTSKESFGPYKVNPGRKRLTVEEAKELARAYGVEIGDDIEIIPTPRNEMIDGPGTRAEFLSFFNKQYLEKSHFMNGEGKIVVRVRRSLLMSEEAIVSTLAHEMHDINSLLRIIDETGPIRKDRLMRLLQYNYLQPDGTIGGILHREAIDREIEILKIFRTGD